MQIEREDKELGLARNGGETSAATPKSAAPDTHGTWEWTRRDGEFTALAWRHPEGGGGYILEPDAICDDDRAGVDVSIFVSEDHARLIAAAPDLLEALQFVMSAHGEQLHDAFEAAHKAIAKALPPPPSDHVGGEG